MITGLGIVCVIASGILIYNYLRASLFRTAAPPIQSIEISNQIAEDNIHLESVRLISQNAEKAEIEWQLSRPAIIRIAYGPTSDSMPYISEESPDTSLARIQIPIPPSRRLFFQLISTDPNDRFTSEVYSFSLAQ